MNLSERANRARRELAAAFGPGGDIVVASAPGRVNLIGEHTDYNDGFVFPVALDYRIEVAARHRDDRLVRLRSVDFGESLSFDLDEPLRRSEEAPWSNYPRGVLWALAELGLPLSGFDAAIVGDVPLGAGLSSSAALEVAVAMALQALQAFPMSGPEMARLAQRAENHFVGMNCGIMDQFISRMGEADHALLLDCRSLDYRLVPLALGAHRLLICESGVKHSLVDSEYNTRRAQCEAGVAALRALHPSVIALRDLSLAQLQAAREALDPLVFRRCRHVVSENERVLASVSALEAGDLAAFGAAMNASHDSLRDDYEVSCPEVDLLVALARTVPGVLGARITGGGFGGCTVNLVREEALAEFEARVLGPYRAETGVAARSFVTGAAPGALVLA